MRCLRFSCALVALSLTLPRVSDAQTDYYNTDRGRPFQTQDAAAVERRAFDIQAAPLRFERSGAGADRWGVEPEVAFGLLPRTQVELGVPVMFIDAVGRRRSGISGLDVSLLHNFNAETSIPALAIAASALLPVGNLAADATYVGVTGIATKTFSWARFHLNGEYTFGPDTATLDQPLLEVARWGAGLAIDRTLPLKSLLLGAEVFVAQPLLDAEDAEVSAAVGTRYQYSPRWAIDAGIGRRMTGDRPAWYVTFGSAYALGLPWNP